MPVRFKTKITDEDELVYTITIPKDVILNIAEGSQDLERICELEKSDKVSDQILALYFYLGYCEDDLEMAKTKVNPLYSSAGIPQGIYSTAATSYPSYSGGSSMQTPLMYRYDRCPNCNLRQRPPQYSGSSCIGCNTKLP